jgi:hypothetical protein
MVKVHKPRELKKKKKLYILQLINYYTKERLGWTGGLGIREHLGQTSGISGCELVFEAFTDPHSYIIVLYTVIEEKFEPPTKKRFVVAEFHIMFSRFLCWLEV